MRVTIWGCRGSLPVPGPGTVRYGGKTTCVEVRLAGNSLIIFDAGTGIRNLGERLMEEEELRDIYLILTHPHWDHLMGFPFFRPAFHERFRIHVRGGPIAKETIRRYLEHQMEPPYFPARMSAMKAEFDFSHGIPVVKHVGDAEVVPVPLSHPGGGYGYKVTENGSSFVFLTDNELDYLHKGGKTRSEYLSFCEGADLLLHDAQYTGEQYRRARGWGHSTIASSLSFAHQAGVKRFGLFHHDPGHSDRLLDDIGGHCTEVLEKRGNGMRCFVAAEGDRIVV